MGFATCAGEHLRILQAYRAKKGKEPLPQTQHDGTWEERYKQLRYFRAIGRMPDATATPEGQKLETLILPPEAFPMSGPGSVPGATKEVIELGKQMEANFKRTGFVKDEDHVSPVDESTGPAQRGRVKSLISD